MTSERTRRIVERAFGFDGLPPDWEEMLGESLRPRGPDMLYDVAAAAGIAREHLVLDAGCRDGGYAEELTTRFGCRAVGVDVVERNLRAGNAARVHEPVEYARADLEVLPFGDGSFDFVWCRDVLEMIEQPARALSEFRRVLRPGGGVMLYVAFATDALEPAERERLFRALDLPPRSMDEAATDEVISRSGFEVLAKEYVSPEWLEHAVENDPSDLHRSILTVARMRRARARIEAALGTEWYERIYGWALWSIYLLLGKLQTVAWALRAPR